MVLNTLNGIFSWENTDLQVYVHKTNNGRKNTVFEKIIEIFTLLLYDGED